MPTSRPLLFHGMRSLIAMVCSPSIKRLPPQRRSPRKSVWESAAARSGNRFAVDLPDVRSGRTRDGNPARLHRFRDLAHQLDLQQAVLKPRSLDLGIIRQTELPLERPRRNSLVQEFALLLFGFPAFHRQHALLGGDGDFV